MLRAFACGTAPRASACRTVSAPSLPLSPTEPPRPATGLTINPIREVIQSLATVGLRWRACQVIAQVSESSWTTSSARG